jgi:hypothetical protein
MIPLKAFAVLIGLLIVMNLLKPWGAEGQGFVFLGRRLEGTPNIIAAWSFAAFLATYVSAMWREKSEALPMGIAYGCYVSANLFLFQLRMAPVDNNPIFGVVYAAIALGVSWGAVATMVKMGFANEDAAPGRLLLRSFALLFALMALSDLLKPFVYTETVGFVFLGQRLSGTPNIVAALSFSAFLAAYAWSIWREKKVAVTMGTVYAVYVLANLVLWNFRKPADAEAPLLFVIPYLISAIGVSSGAAILLRKHADRFR